MSKTLGQIAYEAYVGHYPDAYDFIDWPMLDDPARALWETAANAVAREHKNQLRLNTLVEDHISWLLRTRPDLDADDAVEQARQLYGLEGG